MREIGSEFWDVPTINQKNSLFPESTQWFLSGRSALNAIIKELGEARSVSLPSWCCDSMIKPFIDAGMEVRFYPVYWREGQLIQEWSFDCDVLFLIDYFGYTGAIPDLNGLKGTVIRDVTHSIFSTSYSDADYYFGSLRKWCGVWTGGYAWAKDGRALSMADTDDNGYIPLREKAMKSKNSYIHGWGEEDKEYLKIFAAVYKEVAADARNADDATLRTSTLELENARLEEENRSNNAKELLDWVGKAALVGTTLFTGIIQIWMFRRSTKKETDEAYLTTTDRTIVQESLTGRFWNKFGSKSNK